MNRDLFDRADVIEVYCDDERHARGKVAEVSQLVPVGVAGRYFWTNVGPQKRTKRERRRPLGHGRSTRDPLRGSPTRHDAGTPSHIIPCPLCPRRPALTDEHLQGIADALAERGHTRVSLATLDRYAAIM